jgi:predicted transcriptional regulator
MATSTIDISENSRDLLNALAQKTGQTTTVVLDKALAAYRRQVFFDEMNTGYAALRANSQSWAEHETERQSLDSAMADGLETEHWTENGERLTKD